MTEFVEHPQVSDDDKESIEQKNIQNYVYKFKA